MSGKPSRPMLGPESNETLRLFVALRFPESVRMAIWDATAPLRRIDASVRWTPVDQLHITVRFLGDVAVPAATDVDRRLAEAARRRGPFTLTLRRVGAFPSMKRPRVLWLGTEPSPPITALHRSIEAAVEECGFEPDTRSFRPHVTLGRVRPPRRGGPRPADPRGIARAAGPIDLRTDVTLTHLYLMRSRLGPGGAEHTVRGSYPLTGEPVLPRRDRDSFHSS